MRNWRARKRPNRDPKFHIRDRFMGAGRSIIIPLRGRKVGLDLRI